MRLYSIVNHHVNVIAELLVPVQVLLAPVPVQVVVDDVGEDDDDDNVVGVEEDGGDVCDVGVVVDVVYVAWLELFWLKYPTLGRHLSVAVAGAIERVFVLCSFHNYNCIHATPVRLDKNGAWMDKKMSTHGT